MKVNGVCTKRGMVVPWQIRVILLENKKRMLVKGKREENGYPENMFIAAHVFS